MTLLLLMQCLTLFASTPSGHPRDLNKIRLVLSILTGKTLDWTAGVCAMLLSNNPVHTCRVDFGKSFIVQQWQESRVAGNILNDSLIAGVHPKHADWHSSRPTSRPCHRGGSVVPSRNHSCINSLQSLANIFIE